MLFEIVQIYAPSADGAQQAETVLQKLVWIGLAGCFGTLARYGLSGVVDRRIGETFPAGTLVVNLTGCFVAGLVFQITESRFLVDPAIRAAILIGFLGGFTTFSSFGVQTFTLMRDGEFLYAAFNVLGTNLIGLALVWAGYIFSKIW
jgi:fluoride exporter